MVRTLLCEVKRMGNRGSLIFVIVIALAGSAVLIKDHIRPDSRDKGIVTASAVENPSNPTSIETPLTSLAGTWILQTGLGSITIKLRPDGVAFLGDQEFRWQSDGSTGFRGTVKWDSFGSGHPKPHTIFGHVTPGGDLLTNFDPAFGGFSKSEQNLYKRVE